MTNAMKIPGPDHPITVTRNPARVIVKVGDTVIADTREALALCESTYGAVQYIPRKDVDMALLERTDRSSYCPFKGDASYFSIKLDAPKMANAIWTYETPYDAVAAIGSHLAFYPDRVEIIEHPAG